jgi:hypothetical protein
MMPFAPPKLRARPKFSWEVAGQEAESLPPLALYRCRDAARPARFTPRE